MSWEYPHLVTLYAPPDPDLEVDPYDPADGPFWSQRAAAVDANLQPLTGSVQQQAAGREVVADWKGFVPPGTVVVVDDGMEVTAGPGAPMRFRVAQVGPLGDDWDTELLLRRTEEEFTLAP